MVGLAAGPEARGVPRVPAPVLETGDRELGDLPGRQPDGDVDDPVLLAADDRVAREDHDGPVLRGRLHRWDGAGPDLANLDHAVGDGLLEKEIRGRRVVGAGVRALERHEHEPVALHRHARAEADEDPAQRIARALVLGVGGEGAGARVVVHGCIVNAGRATLAGTRPRQCSRRSAVVKRQESGGAQRLLTDGRRANPIGTGGCIHSRRYALLRGGRGQRIGPGKARSHL